MSRSLHYLYAHGRKDRDPEAIHAASSLRRRRDVSTRVSRSSGDIPPTLAQATASALASLAIEPEREVDEPTRTPVFKAK